MNWPTTPSFLRPSLSLPSPSREWQLDHFIDWHPAPRRQYIISLSGNIEIELGNGTKHTFHPGDARLVEDTTGKGHITRVPGDTPSISAVIPLA